MDAAMVLGLIDPQGGKVKRSDYDLKDNDYVIQSGDTVDTVASAMKVPSQLITDQGEFRTGDVIQGFESIEGKDSVGRLDPSTINWDLLKEVASEEDLVEFNKMLENGLDQDEYTQIEEGAFFSLIQPSESDLKKFLNNPEQFRSDFERRTREAETRYPDIFNRLAAREEPEITNPVYKGENYKGAERPSGPQQDSYGNLLPETLNGTRPADEQRDKIYRQNLKDSLPFGSIGEQ